MGVIWPGAGAGNALKRWIVAPVLKTPYKDEKGGLCTCGDFAATFAASV